MLQNAAVKSGKCKRNAIVVLNLHLLCAGLNVGCFYAVSTLLNRMIIEHYPVSPRLSDLLLQKTNTSELLKMAASIAVMFLNLRC